MSSKLEIVKEFIERFDLIVLPSELDKLEIDKPYRIDVIFKRLKELSREHGNGLTPIPADTTKEMFVECCQEYEKMNLGFKVIGESLIRIKISKQKKNEDLFASYRKK
jgi:hypothetical protein